MRAIGEQPIFLARIGREEPVTPFRAPGGKVAMLRQTAGLAHAVKHPFEHRMVGQMFLIKAE